MKNLFYVSAVILITLINTSCTNDLPAQSSQTITTEENDDNYYKEWPDVIICDKAWYDGQWIDDIDLESYNQTVQTLNRELKKAIDAVAYTIDV